MSEYNRHRWAMEWMHGGGRDPKGRSLDDEIRIGKEDWMERQRVAQGGRIGFKHGGSWADWMSNHSEQMTFEEYLKMDMPKPVHPINKSTGGTVPQLVQPGRMEFRKGKKVIPPKTTAAHEVKKLKPDFLGKFNDKLVYQKNMDDVFEVYNVIKKNKGRISSLDDLAIQANFITPGGKTNRGKTQLALDLLKTGDFADDIKDFKFLKDLYPKLDHKGFRNLDMVADSIINYRGTIGIDRDEALAQFLPENM